MTKSKKLKRGDLLGKFNFNLKINKSEPACMECLPPTPLNGHAMIGGVMVHSRIDCPPGVMYMLNDNLMMPKTQVEKGEF